MVIEVYGAAIPITFLGLLFGAAGLAVLGAYLVGITLTERGSHGGLDFLIPVGLLMAVFGFAATAFLAAAGAVLFFGCG